MAKRGFLEKQGIKRNAIRKDLFRFALPALLLFAAGIFTSTWDGYQGLPATISNIVRRPGVFLALPLHALIGLGLITLGFSTMFVALGTLRKNYASSLIIREDHQLVTHGIYRHIRHPIYLGALMVCIGVPLFASSLRGLVFMLALIPVILYRISMEERLLSEEFGDAYLNYRDTTNKLIPFIC